MLKGISTFRFSAVALIALSIPASVLAQGEMQLRARHLPGWDPRSREGRCVVRLWVDNKAEVRLRGEDINLRTLQGAKAHDEGSECTQPLPLNHLANFRVHQTSGRNQVNVLQQPSRMNNYTALMSIDDHQGGGSSYVFEVNWQSDSNLPDAPAPFFDETRACQETVRQKFLTQNGRGAYLDFDNFPDRKEDMGPQGRGRGRGRGSDQERITGNGTARSRTESRPLTYTCIVDTRRDDVLSGTYQYTGNTSRGNNGRGGLR